MNFIIILVAYLLIYIAVDLGRPEVYKFGFLTWQRWVQIALVTAGGIILSNVP